MITLRRVAVLFLLVCMPLRAQCAVSGRVYLDANGNGQFDPAEKPVADCLVSDGQNLVCSDAAGRYHLEPGAGPVTIFVVNPPQTAPAGRWWATFADGQAPPQLDFGLRSQPQEDPLLFIQGTDLHVHASAMPLYRQYLEHLNALRLPVQFVVHTGDLVVDALPCQPPDADKLYDLYEQGVATLRLPLRHVIGNHEHVGLGRKDADSRHPDYGKGMYRRRLGPTSYAFRFGQYHFLALDCSTLDPRGKNGYLDRLDDAAAAWGARYLATVHDGEPVILMVHQPLVAGGTSDRLLKALEGKRLLLTICGHGHNRLVTSWGVAPMVMGGAVSYPWHGLGYPPDPWGYVLYRIDDGKVEFMHRDWAAERSFDLTAPAWRQVLSGKQTIAGTVDDVEGTLRRVTCRLGDRQVEARLTRPNHLSSRFESALDCSAIPDGVYPLTLDAGDGTRQWSHVRPVIVRNGQSQALPGDGPALLRFRFTGSPHCAGEVCFNGQTLGAVPGSTGAKPAAADGEVQRDLTFALSRERLTRLNSVVVRCKGSEAFLVSNLRIELGGPSYRDVRVTALVKQRLGPSGAKTSPEVEHVIDLTYRGPRGS